MTDITTIQAKPHRQGSDRHILVLQYGFSVLDLSGVNANMYGSFVNTMIILNKLGYRHIKFKMHPGAGRWPKSYFEKIAKFHNIKCNILQMEPFETCVSWADVVIGPSHTGAMFESLAANKAYIALALPPNNSFDLSYFGDFPILRSLDALPNALDNFDPAKGRRVLNDLYSFDEIPNPGQRFWALMNDPTSQPDDKEEN